MGDVIRFQPRREVKVVRAPAEGEGATILLFTGVRYERHEEPAPVNMPRPAGRGGRRKRA